MRHPVIRQQDATGRGSSLPAIAARWKSPSAAPRSLFLPSRHLFLDALLAAVRITILGLTSSFFIQALRNPHVLEQPAIKRLGPEMPLVPAARTTFPGLRSCLLARLSRRIGALVVRGCRCLPGLPPFLLTASLALPVLAVAVWAYRTPVDISVRAVGTVRSEIALVKVIAPAGGKVARVYVTDGSFVNEGDPLIKLEAGELLSRRKALESRIHSAESRVSQRAELADLYRRLEKTRLELAGLTIVSPARGAVTYAVVLRRGQSLAAGSDVATIRASSRIIECLLPASDGFLIRRGHRVRLQSDAFPPAEYNIIGGTVTGIAWNAPDAWRVRIEADRRNLTAGMTFKVSFDAREVPLLYLPFIRIAGTLKD